MEGGKSLKGRWLKLWRSRPRLSRGWRTVRNLTAVLICLCVLWAWAGYPLPTAELGRAALSTLEDGETSSVSG